MSPYSEDPPSYIEAMMPQVYDYKSLHMSKLPPAYVNLVDLSELATSATLATSAESAESAESAIQSTSSHNLTPIHRLFNLLVLRELIIPLLQIINFILLLINEFVLSKDNLPFYFTNAHAHEILFSSPVKYHLSVIEIIYLTCHLLIMINLVLIMGFAMIKAFNRRVSSNHFKSIYISKCNIKVVNKLLLTIYIFSFIEIFMLGGVLFVNDTTILIYSYLSILALRIFASIISIFSIIYFIFALKPTVLLS